MTDKKLEELKFINNYRKEAIYAEYANFINDPRSYNKITRVQMVREIYDVINFNPNILNYYFNSDELKRLIAFANDFSEITELENYYKLNIIYYNYNINKLKIPLYIKESIKNIKIFNDVNQIHSVLDFTYGFLLTRGVISDLNLEKVYLALKPNDYKVDILSLLNNKHKYSNLITKTYDKRHKTYYYHLSEITHDIIDEFNSFEMIKSYSFNDFININENYFDIKIPVFKNTFNKLKEKISYLNFKDFFKTLIILSQPFFYDQDEWLLNKLNRIDDEASMLLSELKKNVPSWIHNGLVLSTCPCGSGKDEKACCQNQRFSIINKAMFSETLGTKFFDTWYKGLFMTNIKYNYKQFNDFIREISDEEIAYLKELMFEDKDIFELMEKESINDYISTKIINGLKNAIKGRFLAIKYIEQKLLVININTKRYYLISGLSAPLSNVINAFDLPRLIETRLIPLDDRILYDTQISEYPINYSENIKQIINEETPTNIIRSYKDIKKNSMLN